jgi:hypothetical protein
MNFLYPSFLFGLLAISIPIIIHLFNFQKPKKVLFTNVKFLKVVKENTSTRLKLKHLLILLSRIGFILFLVLAFAQPFIESKNSEAIKGDQQVSLYLDNSFSMENELEDGKAIDIGVKSIEALTSLYSPNTKYTLLTNEFEGKDLFFRNKEKILERTTEIKPSNVFRDLRSVYLREIQTTERLSSNSTQKIFWFSDFQKSTSGDLSKLNLDSVNQFYLVPIQNKKSSNVFIDSVWLTTPFLKQQENNTLEIQVYNDGDKDIKDLTLKFYIDNTQVSTASVNIPAKTGAKTNFQFNINKEGQKKCKITFEDYPINFDNEYYFILNVSPKIKILHLFDEENKYLSDVYTNEDIFSIQNDKIGQFDYSLIPVSNLIIIDAVRSIPASLVEPLKLFLRSGGSILFIPSDKADQPSYEKFFTDFSLPKVSIVKTDTASQKVNYQMLPPDLNNPFFKNIFDKSTSGKIDMPFAFPKMQWSGKGQGLLTLKNNTPFLSVFDFDKGKIYLESTPMENAYTNFQNHSIFVPVLYKIAFNSISESERLSYSLQEGVINVDLSEKDVPQIYTLTSDNFKVIPDQRVIGRKLIIELPKEHMKAGFYELTANNVTERILAFNYGKEESHLEFFSSEDLKKAFSQYKNVHIYDVKSSNEFITGFKKDNIGIPLWKYSLILSLIFLLIEILLIRFL